MKKILITLFIALTVCACGFCAVLSSNSLNIEISGYMAPKSSFVVAPTSQIKVDTLFSQGRQVPIATYTFTTNSLKDTQLTVSPINNDYFALSASDTDIPYEVAICSMDSMGNITAISQAPTTNTVNIRSGAEGVASYGEIYACFPFDDTIDQKYASAIEQVAVAGNAKSQILSSQLFLALVIV